MSNKNVIGPHIRRARYAKGWTQDQLAAKMQIAGCDMSSNQIAKIESKFKTIKDYELLYLAHVLGFELPAPIPR
jgi:transcriptional regulator with XRE-family HTH domain